MKLPISDMQGKKLGEYDLDEALLVFDKGRQVVYEAVLAYRANGRAGTASTLEKGEVRGSNAKPWKQKGLGRARAGSRGSPIWRGGGVAFGPKPRSYRKKQTRKAARLAFRRAFSEKVSEGVVEVIDSLKLDAPKTRDFAAVLDSLKVDDFVLFVVKEVERNVALASRNIPGVQVTTAQRVNVYDLVRYPRIIVARDALDTLQGRLGQAQEAAK